MLTENENATYNKNLIKLIVSGGLIIFAVSLEAIIAAKSSELFAVFKSSHQGSTFSDYISFVLLILFSRLIDPSLIVLYSFFTYKRVKPGRVYKLIFGGIIILRLMNHILTLHFQSVFYYILIALYIAFFTCILSFANCAKDVKI